MKLELPSSIHRATIDISSKEVFDIKPGDTISTHRDDCDSGTPWTRELPQGFTDVDRWFALVQSIKTIQGKKFFDVIWYYRPSDTLCGLMRYPWNNELFLSTHCSCEETHKIAESEVLGVHQVEFGGTSETSKEFFCRQTYMHEERKWITFEEEHLRCQHVDESSQARLVSNYKPGDTLLVLLDDSEILEPCELVDFCGAGDVAKCRLRRLLRRKMMEPASLTAKANELVYTEDVIKVSKSKIYGFCQVRCFGSHQVIPTPYNLDGVGGFFFITHKVTGKLGPGSSHGIAPLEAVPSSLKQGYDPENSAVPRLRGLDLFCGGGNFGRGLTEAGAVDMRWANDYDAKAIHTYMANASDPEQVHPFLGSVNSFQELALQGNFAENVPHIGEVDFISGGSPCPGFSHLTNDKTTPEQRLNQSLVAAFASCIDLYRPKYGALENVPGIVQRGRNRDQDMCSQLICALVGLGYQTQLLLLDALAYGSPQFRSRVFIVFAAPGYKLPRRPLQTHSYPLNAKNLSLGRLPTGDAMVERDVGGPAPFKYVTIEEATADLPDIHDSKPDICVPFPDHRVSIGQTKVVSARLRLIPKQPYGMNFAKAWYGETPGSKEPGSGVLTPAERSTYRNVPGEFSSVMHAAGQNSNAYGRVYPNRPISTVTTVPVPGDAKVGRILHWEEDRVMTIMEARRAQGIRDDEVILGSPQVQYKIVGNSVAREVAVALGAVLRDAYAESYRARQQRTMESHSSEGGLIKVCMEDLSDLVMTDSADDTGVSTTYTGKYPSPTVESDVVVETVEIERKRRRSSETEVPSPSKKKHQMSRFNRN